MGHTCHPSTWKGGGTQEDPDLHGQPHLYETLSQVREIIIPILFGVGENVKYEQRQCFLSVFISLGSAVLAIECKATGLLGRHSPPSCAPRALQVFPTWPGVQVLHTLHGIFLDASCATLPLCSCTADDTTPLVTASFPFWPRGPSQL